MYCPNYYWVIAPALNKADCFKSFFANINKDLNKQLDPLDYLHYYLCVLIK